MNLKPMITTSNSKSRTETIETMLKLIFPVNSFAIGHFKDHKNN